MKRTKIRVKYIIRPKSDKKELTYDDLTDSDMEIINKVIKDTKAFYWNEFINYVYSTSPIKNSSKYETLDFKKFI